jgi:hypothetical protein
MQDMAFPDDSGRVLRYQEPNDSTSDSSERPFNQVAIYVAGVGLVLLLSIWCISSYRSFLATRRLLAARRLWVTTVTAILATSDVNATTAAPVLLPQQGERAGDAIKYSTLAQRKHAILELFRTSQVTMVRDEVRGGVLDRGVSPIADHSDRPKEVRPEELQQKCRTHKSFSSIHSESDSQRYSKGRYERSM